MMLGLLLIVAVIGLVSVTAVKKFREIPEGEAEPEGAVLELEPECQAEVNDGPFRICINRDGDDVYAWLATREGIVVGGNGGFTRYDDALADAWMTLAVFPVPIVDSTTQRAGLRLEPDGEVTVENQPVYVNFVAGAISQETMAGGGPLDLVITALAAVWPALNPLRMRPNGGTLDAAAERVAAAGQNPLEIARAIFDLPI
jgi:hypothetical protein